MNFKISMLLGILLVAASCISPEKLLNKSSSQKIFFGKYGGFTNIPVEYVLLNNRFLFKIEDQKYIRTAKIQSKQSEEIQSYIKAAGLPGLQLNEPGNMTYYIRIQSEGTDREIKWTDQSQYPEVWKLYKALNSLVNPTKQ